MEILINFNQFKPFLEELEVLQKELKNCNWENFNNGSKLYFSSACNTAEYDFIVEKGNNFILLNAVLAI